MPGPAVPLQFGPNAPSFLTLLLGSVTDNQLAGMTFQARVLQELALPENFMLIPPELLLGRARPDAITTTDLYEIKNVVYQARTRQLRIQLRYARDEGVRFNLIVRSWTRISQPLNNAIKQVDGRTFRALGKGLYARVGEGDDAAPSLYRFVDGDFERVNLAPKALTEPFAGRGVTAADRIGEESAAEEPTMPAEEIPEIPEPEIIPVP